MKANTQFAVVLVTAPGLRVARGLARAALQKRLVACANLLPRVESHYRWQGKLETGSEVLMILKTARTRLKALEEFILSEHPYDTPEFVVVSLTRGNRRYLAWLESCVA